MPQRKPYEPGPIELFFMLVDSCMHRLSPNAWKVLCYVAAQHLRVHEEWLQKIRDPGGSALSLDLEKVGVINSPGESEERPYRRDADAPPIPGERTNRFAVISLDVLCSGLRIKRRRRRDDGTGLSKSSVAEAIKEAVRSGILVHKRSHTLAGRSQSSHYAINWDRVQNYDGERRRGRCPAGGQLTRRRKSQR